MTQFVIADTYITTAGPVNGAIVWAYKMARFNGVPSVNTAPPAGSPDAGPVTTGTAFGGNGAFQLIVPTQEQYYVLVTFDGMNSWKLYDVVVLWDEQGTQLQGPLDMAGNAVTSVADAVNPTDAVNLETAQTLDAAVLTAAEAYTNAHGGGGGGGTVTSVTAGNGTITIAGTSTAPTVAVTGGTFDASGAAATVQTNLNNEATTRAAADTTNATAIATETTRATTAEGTKASATLAVGGDLTGNLPNPTLATSGVTAGTYGDATHVAQVTLDAKGRATAASNVTITGAAPTGSAGGDLTGTYPNPTLAAAGGGAAGPTGSATVVPVVTVDAKGRTTALTSANIAIPHTDITDWASATGSFLTSLSGALLAANNLSDLGSVVTALSNLGIPRLMAPAYGIKANGTDQTALLNSLIEYACSLGGAVIQMPRGLVTVAGPVLMQQGVYLDWGIADVGATVSAGLIRAASSASDVMQFQCYVPLGAYGSPGAQATAVTWSPSSVVYTRGNIIVYSGNYYLCEVTHTSTAATPPTDFYHWTVFSPVNTTTCSAGAALSNTSNATVTVASAAGFSTLGGIRQIASTVVTYTGVSGSTITGVNTFYAGATYTTLASDPVIPISASDCGTIGGTIHCGWAGGAVVGDWHHAVNVSCTKQDSEYLFSNTVVKGAVGDGVHVTSWVGGGAQLPTNGVRFLNCFPTANWGTGLLINGPDSTCTATNSSYNGLGGIALTTTASLISDSCKSVNNGTVPIFISAACRTVTDGVTNGTTTFTSVTANFTADDTGQGIYDTGNVHLPVNNWIVDVISSTQVLLKIAASGSASGLTVNIGGYFSWPTGTSQSTGGPTASNSPLVVDATNGIAYLLKVSSVGGTTLNNTPPSSDTTNWQPIRLATEWRWGMAGAANPGVQAGELSIRGDVQECPGGVLLQAASGSIVDVTTSGMCRNPATGHIYITALTVPTNLVPWTIVGVISTNNSLLRAANSTITSSLYLTNVTSSISNTIEIATPGSSAGNLYPGGSFASNLVIINGVFVAGSPGNVTSVFGRTGAVVAAGGDYAASQVSNALDLSASGTQTMSGTLAMAAQQITFSGSSGAAIAAGSRRIQAAAGTVSNPTSLTPWDQVFGADLVDNGASGASVNSFLGGTGFGTLAGASSVNLGTQVSAVLGLPHGGTGASSAAGGLANLGGLPAATFQKITAAGFTALGAGTWKITAVGGGGNGGAGAVGVAGQVGGGGGGAGGVTEDYYASPGNTTAAGTAGALSWTGIITAGSNIAYTGTCSVGDIVSSGSNVPIGTYITSVAGGNVQLSAATTATGTAVTQSGIYVSAIGGYGGDTTVTANAVTSWLDGLGGGGGATAAIGSTVVGGGVPGDRLNNSVSTATFPGVGGPSGKRPGSYHCGLTVGGGGGFGATGTVGGTGGGAATASRSFLPGTGVANSTSSGTVGASAAANTGGGGGGGGAAFTGGTAGSGGLGGSGFVYAMQVA